MAAAPALRPLTIGEVLDTAFSLYRMLFVPLLIIAVVCRTAPTVLNVYVTAAGGFLVHPVLGLVGVALTWLATAFAVAAVTFVVSHAYLGRAMTAGTALRNAASLIGRVSAVSILTAIAVMVGFLLLIVPGFIFAAGLALSTVVLVLEQPVGPVTAMDRSWNLTKGFRWKVFITILVASLLLVIPLMIVAVVAGFASVAHSISPVATQVVTAVLAIFVYPFSYIVTTVLYYDLRVRKEGFDLELLSAATAAP